MRVQRLQPGLALKIVRLEGLGHLAHEESPGAVAEAIEHAVASEDESRA